MLIDWGADPQAKTTTGNTALLLACERGHLEMARVITDGGGDLEASNTQGFRREHLVSDDTRLCIVLDVKYSSPAQKIPL